MTGQLLVGDKETKTDNKEKKRRVRESLTEVLTHSLVKSNPSMGKKGERNRKRERKGDFTC